MKSYRFCLQSVSIFCILAFFVGCGSQIQKADKLAMSDPKSAVASYEQVMKSKPGTEEAKQAHLKIADTYYKQANDPQKGLEVYAEVAKAYPKTRYAGEAEKAIGMHYFQAKEYDKAIEAFNKAAEEVPESDVAADSMLMVGKSYEDAKKFEDAVRVYLDFSKNHPTHRLAAQAALNAAKIYEKELDKQDEAIETYKFVASKYSISSSAREAREALTNLGVDASEIPTGTAQAGAGTSQVQAQPQNEPKTVAQLGTRTRRRATNAPPPEIGSIRRTDATGPQGAQTAQAAAAQARSASPDFGIDPLTLLPDISADQQGTMYDALYMIGITYLQAGQYKESGALFEKSLQMIGNKPWTYAASAYLLLGKSYKGIGNKEKATQMYKEAIKRDSKVIDQMIRDGETQYGEDEYEKALDSYKTALGLVPYKDWDIYYKMGLVYIKLKDSDKELDAFERSVALKPNDNIDALQHLAEVLYYRKNNTPRATLFDAEAKGQGNNDYKVQKELADLCYKYNSYSWASTKYGSGIRIIVTKINDELKKALGTGEEAKKVSEDPTKIDLKLVSDAAAAGNTKATEALQKVATLLDDYRYMSARRALSQTKNKQYVDAQKQLDEAKAKDPGIVDNAEYQYALGEFDVSPDNKQGNKEAGITALKKAVELNPNHQEAINKLKELGL